MKYAQKHMVNATLMDAGKRLSVLGAFTLAQNSLTEFMGELHLDGPTVMKNYGTMLVFTKNRLMFFRVPPWKETLTVESYISSKSLARFYIDTYARDEKDGLCFASRIELCGVDMATGRIRKTTTYGITDEVESYPEKLAFDFCRPEAGELSLVDSVKVKSTNIDYCHHTNNIEYVRFMLNCYTLDELLRYDINGLEVHYKEQSHEGDVLSLYRGGMGGNDFFRIKNGESDVMDCIVFRGKTL